MTYINYFQKLLVKLNSKVNQHKRLKLHKLLLCIIIEYKANILKVTTKQIRLSARYFKLL